MGRPYIHTCSKYAVDDVSQMCLTIDVLLFLDSLQSISFKPPKNAAYYFSRVAELLVTLSSSKSSFFSSG